MRRVRRERGRGQHTKRVAALRALHDQGLIEFHSAEWSRRQSRPRRFYVVTLKNGDTIHLEDSDVEPFLVGISTAYFQLDRRVADSLPYPVEDITDPD